MTPIYPHPIAEFLTRYKTDLLDAVCGPINRATIIPKDTNAMLTRNTTDRPTTAQRSNGGGQTVKAKFESLLEQKLAAGLSRPQAVKAVAKENPGLCEALDAEANS